MRKLYPPKEHLLLPRPFRFIRFRLLYSSLGSDTRHITAYRKTIDYDVINMDDLGDVNTRERLTRIVHGEKESCKSLVIAANANLDEFFNKPPSQCEKAIASDTSIILTGSQSLLIAQLKLSTYLAGTCSWSYELSLRELRKVRRLSCCCAGFNRISCSLVFVERHDMKNGKPRFSTSLDFKFVWKNVDIHDKVACYVLRHTEEHIKCCHVNCFPSTVSSHQRVKIKRLSQ